MFHVNIFSFFKRQDWVLNSAILFLSGASLIQLLSISQGLFYQQLVWVLLSFFIIFFLSAIDWRAISNYRWLVFGIYLFSTLLLCLTFFAPIVRESRGWIDIGFFRFQPSELTKISLIIIFAYFFGKRHVGIANFSVIGISLIYLAIPALIVFKEPDWGSAMVLISIWITFLLVGGLPFKKIILGGFVLLVLGIFSWFFLFKDYQKERIIGFLNPSYDILGINYSTNQAKIAVGSAGFFGKGFSQGTQTHLGFLTEPSTDFIFSSFVEEWGLFGGILILLAFAVIIYRILIISLKTQGNFLKLLTLASASLLLVELFLNIGSNLGLTPVVGVTFPFLSYGGSSFITKAVLIGMVQGAYKTSIF
ncbi:MAG: rod shape-determining protein RodA [Candidatus Pacebacteria bacterium]|nr:rod shape-determining protein RodA [Candidatus Paceibacterota bacterium]